MSAKLVKSNKKGAVLLASVTAVALLAGCGSNSDSNASKESASSGGSAGTGNNAGKKIAIGVEAGGPYTEFYKKLAPQFTEKTGIAVEFQDVPHDNMHERFITEAASGTGALDVFITDQPWISEFAKQGFLEPLDDRLSEEDRKDFVPAALDAVSYDGKIYGLPFLVHTPILYYRTDLFKKAGIDHPPATWDEFRADAKLLNDPAAGVSGTIVEGKQGGEPVTHLMDRFLQAGGQVLDGDKIVLDSPENVNAFKFLLAIQHEDKTSPAGAVSYDNADVHNLFMQGKAAMVFNWPYMYGMAQDPAQSKVSGKFAIAPQPAGAKQASAVWSWGFGVNASSKNKDAAWEFVNWAASSDIVTQLGKQFINPVARTSAVDALNADSSLKDADKQAIAAMSKAVEYGHNVTTTPVFPAIQERLAVSLSKIMTGQASPEDELKAAAKDLEGIVNP